MLAPSPSREWSRRHTRRNNRQERGPAVATIASRHRRPGVGTSVSVGLIVALIVAIAVVLSLAVDNDDNRTDQTTAPRAPLSYIHDGMGEGFVSGEDQAVVPALRSHTSELQGEGHLNTLDDLSDYRPADRPTSGYHPYTEEVGLTEGSITLTYEE